MAPTGITVVTGMLGAGKTTLVNYVLNADHGYRVAVILNEFGAELGVEKMLVQDKPDGDAAVEEWVEMNNGCVCCTVKGSLIQTIDNLLERRAATGRKFDFILLETTGLADPGPVAQELWVDDELLDDDCAVLDAVVTLVDASNVHRQLRENKETALQIAFADTLVLNKTDLVSDADLEEVEHTLAGINADARVVRATRSVVDLAHVLNQGAVTVAGRRGRKPTLGALAEAPPPAVAAAGRGFWARGAERFAPATTSGRAEPSEVHDPGIRTTCLAVEGIVDVRAFETWLEGALWERRANEDETPADVDGDEGFAGDHAPLEILRAKGVLHVAGEGGAERRVLQAVREVYEITEYPPAAEGERLMNKVVLIGRGLREEALLEGFRRAVKATR